MDAHDFLTAVLPSTGVYCVCELSQHNKHEFVDTVEAAAAKAAGFGAKNLNTYVALASFEKKGNRTAANARFMRSLFIDIDIDPDGIGGKYMSKREAVVALNTFLQETHLDTLGKPWLVDSGGGVHAYWPLTNDVAIAEWKPIAERLKKLAAECELQIDMTVTADAARVLRMPGTLNQKYHPPKLAALKNRGATFDLAAIASLLPEGPQINGNHVATTLNIPGTRPIRAGAPTPVATALANHIPSSFDQIVNNSLAGGGCQQLAWFYDHASEPNKEGMWRAMLSIAKCTDEGIEAGREISAWHPYEEARLQKKWSEIKGPYSCGKIESENPGGCDGCPHRGKITNPVQLGWAYAPMPTPATATMPALPAPPKGFVFKDNKVWRVLIEKGEEEAGRLQPVVNYPFFLHSMMQEDAFYAARFCKVLKGTTTYIKLPTKALPSKDDTLKKLAEQGILPATGGGMHLFNYVNAAALEALDDNKSMRVPPKLGWQPDGGFAYGNRVISISGEETFISDKLNNLIEGMQPKGTLADWQRVMKMLCDKGCYEVVTLGLIGFASPLMQWDKSGAGVLVFHAGSRTSGVGKSLGLSLARSVWGDERFGVVPETSKNTMLQRAGFLGGLPLVVDEVTSKQRVSELEWIPNFVFDFTQGQHKLKGSGSANAELDSNMTWKGLALITSNTPVLEHLTSVRTTSSAGELRRFLEWRGEAPLSFTPAERAIKGLLDHNTGQAGPAFAKWLVHNRATAEDVFEKVMEMWRQQINADDDERQWIAAGGAILTAATLLSRKHANICDIDFMRVMGFLEGLVIHARRLIRSNVITARALIDSFLLKNNGRLVKSTKASGIARGLAGSGMLVTAPDSTRGEVVGRVEVEARVGLTDVYIALTDLKAYCSARNWAYPELLKGLRDEGLLAVPKAYSLCKGTTMPDTVTPCLHLSYPASAPSAATSS